jgi:hypothetical protein
MRDFDLKEAAPSPLTTFPSSLQESRSPQFASVLVLFLIRAPGTYSAHRITSLGAGFLVSAEGQKEAIAYRALTHTRDVEVESRGGRALGSTASMSKRQSEPMRLRIEIAEGGARGMRYDLKTAQSNR